MLDTVIGTTTSVGARMQVELLSHELDHRLKNIVTMMQSLAVQTLRDVADRGVVDALLDRLAAMGRAHDVLLAASWTATDPRVVAETVLAPHDPGARLTLNGPPVTLGQQAVLGVSLMLHAGHQRRRIWRTFQRRGPDRGGVAYNRRAARTTLA